MTKVSSTNLSHKNGGCGQELRVLTSNSSNKQVGNERTDGGPHNSTLNLFIILTLEEEVSIGEAEFQ